MRVYGFRVWTRALTVARPPPTPGPQLQLSPENRAPYHKMAHLHMQICVGISRCNQAVCSDHRTRVIPWGNGGGPPETRPPPNAGSAHLLKPSLITLHLSLKGQECVARQTALYKFLRACGAVSPGHGSRTHPATRRRSLSCSFENHFSHRTPWIVSQCRVKSTKVRPEEAPV